MADQPNEPAMSDEQAQNLRALELGANAPDQAMQQLEAKEADQAQAVLDQGTVENVQSIMLMLGIAVPLLSKLYPSLAAVYTEEACASVASSVGPVLTKYNITLGDLGGQYKEEITMVVVCWPIAAATYEGIKADILTRSQQMPKAVASNSQQPGAKQGEPERLG